MMTATPLTDPLTNEALLLERRRVQWDAYADDAERSVIILPDRAPVALGPGHPYGIDQVESERVDHEIMSMVLKRIPFSQIGRALGMTKQSAHERYQKLIRQQHQENADLVLHVQASQYARLDKVQASMEPLMWDDHDPDFRPDHRDVASYVRVSESMRRIYGADAAQVTTAESNEGGSDLVDAVVDIIALADKMIEANIGSGIVARDDDIDTIDAEIVDAGKVQAQAPVVQLYVPPAIDPVTESDEEPPDDTEAIGYWANGKWIQYPGPEGATP